MLAWNSAAYARQKRLPNIQVLLRRIDRPGPPTAKDIQATRDAMDEAEQMLQAYKEQKAAKLKKAGKTK